jgi:hypothetical protein
MTTTLPPSDLLMEEKFDTVIHRSPGIGQDLDLLKSLHAKKILLITRDHTTQRRLRLQTLTDPRFVVLTEDKATAAQIQSLQQQREELQQELEREKLENDYLAKQLKMLEVQVELLRDCLVPQEPTAEAPHE